MSENPARGAAADEADYTALDANLGSRAGVGRTSPRLLGIFVAWRLQACGYTLAIAYAAVFFIWFKAGVWLVDSNGVPLDTDFIYWWVGGTQALHGEVTSIYDAAQLKEMLAALV